MIDFPSSPTIGQQFASQGMTWVWDGVKWTPAGASSTVVQAMNDNRIINGDMRIDQRNNGASGTGNQYTVDRWQFNAAQAGKGTWSRATSGLAGFPFCLGFQSSSAYSSVAADYFLFQQPIEADMVSDFAWGASGAQSVTLSFWTNSSKTGNFSGSICNYAFTRSYPFTFNISTASAWTKIVITIPGDTAGTWVMNGNGGSMYLNFDLGCGTNYRAAAGAWASGYYLGVTGAQSIVATNAAFLNITGVKLEVGSIATPYNRQSLAKSLADCQRYFEKSYGQGVVPGTAAQGGAGEAVGLYNIPTTAISGNVMFNVYYKATKRTVPTLTCYSPTTGATPRARDLSGNADVTVQNVSTGDGGFSTYCQVAATTQLYASMHWTASAEL